MYEWAKVQIFLYSATATMAEYQNVCMKHDNAKVLYNGVNCPVCLRIEELSSVIKQKLAKDEETLRRLKLN